METPTLCNSWILKELFMLIKCSDFHNQYEKKQNNFPFYPFNDIFLLIRKDGIVFDCRSNRINFNYFPSLKLFFNNIPTIKISNDILKELLHLIEITFETQKSNFITCNLHIKKREIEVIINIIPINQLLVYIEIFNYSNRKIKKIEPNQLLREKIGDKLLEILKFIYKETLLGNIITYGKIGRFLKITKPTTKKRIEALIQMNYITIETKGRRKIIKLTYKGNFIFNNIFFINK
jgi:DNA-binding MarR family transcriptional regulator